MRNLRLSFAPEMLRNFFYPLRFGVAVVLQQACAAYGGDVVGLGSLGDGAVEA